MKVIKIIGRYVYAFIEYIGLILGYVPIHWLRLLYYRYCMGMKIGKNSSIHRCCQIRKGSQITIGDNVVVGENALLDGRGFLVIGNNVNMSSNVSIYTAQHNYNSPTFATDRAQVTIKDNVWLSCNSVILPGCTVNEGAVVGAMSLINKDVPEYKLVGGVPFKVIKDRSRDIQYKLKAHKPFH